MQVRGEASTLVGAELRPLRLAFASCVGAAAYLTLPNDPPLTETLIAPAAFGVLLVIVRQFR